MERLDRREMVGLHATDVADRPALWVLVLAAVGASLLTVIVALFWQGPNDAFAYWIAGHRLMTGHPIYVPGEGAFEPYAFHYLPPVAQALAPVTLILGPVAYVIVYRAVLLATLWELAGRRFFLTLALIAFVPVAIELRFENVHLLMALAMVWGLRHGAIWFVLAAIVKLSPGLGLLYFLAQRRYREALVAGSIGTAVVTVSFLLDPSLWSAWLESVIGRAGMTGNSLLPVPYVVRAAAGFAITLGGGLRGGRVGQISLVLAVTLANPNLSMNGLAVLAAIVPIWRAGPGGLRPSSSPGSSALVPERSE